MSTCPYDPQEMRGQPLGQFHCPECGEMVLAGLPHPNYDSKPFYQDAKVVWTFWRFDLMRATDGTNALWLTIRLYDGKEPVVQAGLD